MSSNNVQVTLDGEDLVVRCIITAAWLLNGVILFWLTQGDNLTGQWIASGAKGLEIPVHPVMFDDQEQSAAKVNQHREAAFVAAQRKYQDSVDKKIGSSVWREPPPGPRGRPPAARRLVCSICKRECKSKANLTKHMRTHQSGSESGSESGEEEQRVSCGECGKKIDIRGLNKHMTIHKKVPPSGPASTQPTEGMQAMFALLSAQQEGRIQQCSALEAQLAEERKLAREASARQQELQTEAAEQNARRMFLLASQLANGLGALHSKRDPDHPDYILSDNKKRKILE